MRSPLDDKEDRLKAFFNLLCDAHGNMCRITQFETKRTVLTEGKEIYDSTHYDYSPKPFNPTVGLNFKTHSSKFYADLFDDKQLVIWIMNDPYYIDEFELVTERIDQQADEKEMIELSMRIKDVHPI